MNNKIRSKLSSITGDLRSAMSDLHSIYDDERYKLDNIPESLQESDMYYRIEESVDHLDDAISDLSSSIDNIEEAISC